MKTPYRILVLDTLNRRALMLFRFPGQKVTALIQWMPLRGLPLRHFTNPPTDGPRAA